MWCPRCLLPSFEMRAAPAPPERTQVRSSGDDVLPAMPGLVVYAMAAYVPLQHVTRESCMKAAFLPDRGVVKVGGEDARNFLNGLVTTDVTLLQPGLGRFGGLLTPQGKIITDFLITEAPAGHGGGFLIDVPRALAQGLAAKLGFYKLRAKVAVENLTDSLGV